MIMTINFRFARHTSTVTSTGRHTRSM